MKQLGPYQIGEVLGQGGMATVYRAYQPALEREVAIKVIAPTYTTNPSFVQRFQREARATAKLHHPNILTIYDFGQDPLSGEYYIVSELVEGKTLRERLGQPFTLQEAARLLQPLAEALDYAHEMGIVHRDVKPGNILLDRRGRPILGDFGIARIMEGTTELTASGLGVGTPAYMSPEQAMGEGIDGRSDQYSLGIVLYEMLSGKTPFQANTPVAMIMAHATRPLPDPRQYNPSIPSVVVEILTKALAKDQSQRYSTVGQFAQAFTQAIGTSASDYYSSSSGKDKPLTTEVTPTIPIGDTARPYFIAPNPPPPQNFTPPQPVPIQPSPTTEAAIPTGWPTINVNSASPDMAANVPPDAPSIPPEVVRPDAVSVNYRQRSRLGGGLTIALGLALVAIIGAAVTLTLFFSQGKANQPLGTTNLATATAPSSPALTPEGEASPASGASGATTDCSSSGSLATPVFTRLPIITPGAKQGQLNLQILETGCKAAKADNVSVKIYRQNDPNTVVATTCCNSQLSFALPPGTYLGSVSYANGIEQATPAIEVKEGQAVFQRINLQLGQAKLELSESEGKSAKSDEVNVKVFKAGDRNTPVTTSCCDNRLTFYLRPGRYELVASYANGVKIESKPFEIKDGETITQTLNFGVGRLQLSIVETEGKSAKSDEINVKVFKPGDYNTPVTTVCCTNQPEIVLRPGNYEVIATYANGVQAPALPIQISEGQLSSQKINFHVGQASLEIVRANGQALNSGDVSIKIYRASDPNTVVTTACCANKLSFSLIPGRYQVEISVTNVTKTPYKLEIEVKDGQLTTQTVKL